MTDRVTIIKNYRNKETLRLTDLQQVIDDIRACTYQQAVDQLRHYFPLTGNERSPDGTIVRWMQFTRDLPRICFALEMETKGQNRLIRAYSGLVLLEVNNLPGLSEAEAVRQGASEMPQTLLAFVGADGLSVKIVCRGERFPSEGGGLPDDIDAMRLFHENLYERARLIYNGQLGVTIEKLEPLPERICYMAADPKVVFNPFATPVYARAEQAEKDLSLASAGNKAPELTYDRLMSMRTAYEFCLSAAYDDAEGIGDEDEQRHTVLTRLAERCQQTGIPMALARQMARQRSWLNADPQLADKVFENAYRRSHSAQYRERKRLKLTGSVPAETLLSLKIDFFLSENYDLRRNVMRGVTEFRERKGVGFTFRDLTEVGRNSITMRALELGIKCWDKDIRRYVMSDDIPLYDPINDYLEHLAPWDGHDRVEELARRVPTQYDEWPHLFHVWMRSMVAMWLGKGQLTGNALVPLLIGRQGCGKSSFCRILLPAELQDYYNDRISFKNEQDLNLGLTAFALINLDEFDRVTQRQQVVLKYLVSTSGLKYRPPYGKAYVASRRYASFIGTTNEVQPLTDPSGSRRFVSVLVDGNIDFSTPVYHDQLYAQLLHEIDNGQPYWLSKDEERRLMNHNLQFQRINGLGEMLMSIVAKPEPGEEGRWMTLKELSDILASHFKGYREEPNMFGKMGQYLNRPEYQFESRRTNSSMVYHVKLLVE